MSKTPTSKVVEFFFDFGSPTAYLAYTQLPAIAARTGATIKWRPFLLGGVFKATGNAAPWVVPAKGPYGSRDMERFAKRYGVELARNPFFPINTLLLMRGAAGYEGTDRFMAYVDAIYDGMWRRPRNMGDIGVLSETLSAAGFDPAEFQALIEDPAVKDRLKATTEEAVARGAFGAPTFFVDGEMFFGQDRLDFVEEVLAA
jgi:2-hydroxychromene-2-carboxylate isomerase